ncbi:hypothetical protein [Marinomonas algarum]|uniref:Uncharacterized protein n=1 Tax=Marinomonas algarum TaxID=2883105 RepID=A0A9X1LFE1_9GAMM|nr:hypothetical protein [Marinomonas algarum]MCB5162946.1 hypothetical protein [Marinomonas algarum]
MNHQLNQIKSAMAELSETLQIPEIYKSDLEMDYAALERFKGAKKLVWLLRSYGTVLVPAGIGVDPVFITHWLNNDHGQVVVPFVIDIETAKVEKVSFDQARKVIAQPPLKINATMSRNDIVQKVETILEKGRDLKCWGAKENTFGYWPEWKNHFEACGNHMMSDLMGDAIRQLNSRP